jgi:hypothetical protein
MRTTVTLDHDVQELLRDAMRQTGQGFKVTLNQAIRNGLVGTSPTVNEQPFVVFPKPMGLRPGIDPAQLQNLGDESEVDGFLETTHKLMQAKKESE